MLMSDDQAKDESTSDSEQQSNQEPADSDQPAEQSDAQPAYDQSSPVPPEFTDSKEYAQGSAEGDPAAYYAGEQAGRSDTIHKRSSLTPPEYEGNEAYAKGYADGLAALPYLSDVEAEQKAEEDAGTPKLPKLDVPLRVPEDVPIYDAEHPQPPSMSPVMPGDLPPPPPEGEDEEMPHAEYGPERPGQTWNPKTHSYQWDWEIREDELKTGAGEGEATGD
jgi:hypothetical protein